MVLTNDLLNKWQREGWKLYGNGLRGKCEVRTRKGLAQYRTGRHCRPKGPSFSPPLPAKSHPAPKVGIRASSRDNPVPRELGPGT